MGSGFIFVVDGFSGFGDEGGFIEGVSFGCRGNGFELGYFFAIVLLFLDPFEFLFSEKVVADFERVDLGEFGFHEFVQINNYFFCLLQHVLQLFNRVLMGFYQGL